MGKQDAIEEKNIDNRTRISYKKQVNDLTAERDDLLKKLNEKHDATPEILASLSAAISALAQSQKPTATVSDKSSAKDFDVAAAMAAVGFGDWSPEMWPTVPLLLYLQEKSKKCPGAWPDQL